MWWRVGGSGGGGEWEAVGIVVVGGGCGGENGGLDWCCEWWDNENSYFRYSCYMTLEDNYAIEKTRESQCSMEQSRAARPCSIQQSRSARPCSIQCSMPQFQFQVFLFVSNAFLGYDLK